VYISWSAETEALASSAKEMLQRETGKTFKCFHHKTRRSQFEHYRFLARRVQRDVQPGSLTWVLFSDDDDVWQPIRLQFYCMMIESMAPDVRMQSMAVTCAWFAQRASGYEHLPPVKTADEVEVELAKGRMFVEDLSAQPDAFEHWSACVRLERVLAFFDTAPEGLVSSLYCDVAFARFFGKGHTEDIMTHNVGYQKDSFPWLYAYNASHRLDVSRATLRPEVDDDTTDPNQSQSHAGSDPAQLTPEDHALAKRVLPELTREWQDFGVQLGYSERELAAKMARERRSFTVLAVSRLWVPSTVVIQEDDGSECTPQARADTLVRIALQDLHKIWAIHGLSQRERSFNICFFSKCLGPAVRDVLESLGFEGADMIADAWEAKWRDLWEKQRTLGIEKFVSTL
jgi:hypothetical protein